MVIATEPEEVELGGTDGVEVEEEDGVLKLRSLLLDCCGGGVGWIPRMGRHKAAASSISATLK